MKGISTLQNLLRSGGVNEIAWDDLQFQISSGKPGAANVPTWEAFTTNTSAYSFAINDYIDLGANEPCHGWKLGSDMSVHLHLALKAANATGSDRFAKFQVDIAYANVGAAWAEATQMTAEVTIPTGTVALHHFLLLMGTLSIPTGLIGVQIKPRVKRIAATGGTEYASSVFITQLGIHLQKDTVGSRSVAAK